MQRKLFLVAYDVRQPRRLRRMLNVLKDYASGGQKSAFECYLSQSEKAELVARVRQVIDVAVDSFVIIRLQGKNSVKTLGIGIIPKDEQYTYLG